MDKFLLILFFIIKILVIIVVPVLFFRLKRKEIKKIYYVIEIVALIAITVLYLIGFPYVVDSKITNILNIKMLEESLDGESNDFTQNLNISKNIKSLDANTEYKTHRNEDVYYYNGYDLPLAGKQINCNNDYDYFKSYSDIMTSTSMLLSTYFNKKIDPIEIYNKALSNGLIKCGEPINKDSFFYMITNEYKVNFKVLDKSELRNYVLNGKPVLMETIGNGSLSCYQTYYLIYDISNADQYLLLDPNNKSYRYICPEGTKGFGNILKANYNELSFDYSELLSDTSRFIVIGGTR
ncbi:MAG: hypothetical protein IKZ96_01455 [Bacilli bacterium]|nr:hypothetical protein [Bacilli bacterium]